MIFDASRGWRTSNRDSKLLFRFYGFNQALCFLLFIGCLRV